MQWQDFLARKDESGNSSWGVRIVSSCTCAARAGGEAKRSLWDLLYQDCVKSPYVWLFAIAYFFVYVVRQGVTSWFIFYLQARSLSDAQAATCSNRLFSRNLRVIAAQMTMGHSF